MCLSFSGFLVLILCSKDMMLERISSYAIQFN